MKAQKIATALVLGLLIPLTSLSQVAVNSSGYPNEKQKIRVDLKITPSLLGFRAGISEVEGHSSKIKIWVSNSEQKRFSVDIRNAGGSLWACVFRDAWYSQIFDLSQLEDGEYEIRVSTGNESVRKTITIYTNSYVQRDVKIE